MSDQESNQTAVDQQRGLKQHDAAEEPSFYQAWSRSMRSERNSGSINLFKAMIIVTVSLWVWLPFFWGSSWLELRYLHKLTIAAVNLEGPDGSVGPVLTQMAQQTNEQPKSIGRLGFAIEDASDYPGGIDDVRNTVGYSGRWGAIVALPNCTSAWEDALSSGDASYDPTGCLAVFYSSGRFYQITVPYLLPAMKQTTSQIASQAASSAVSQWISTNAGNDAALTAASDVPQAISPAFSYFVEDTRPVNAWAIVAPLEASLIYFMILSCYPLALWHYMARAKQGFNNKVTLPTLVLWRLGVSAFCYFWLSLAFTTLFPAFQIPLQAAYGHAGFVVLWVVNFLGLTALGWMLENLLTFLTPKFFPFSLIAVVIMNITSSFTPLELTQEFYQFVKWLPFYHMVTAYKIIVFRIYPPGHLGVNVGALLGVSGVNIIFAFITIALERRQAIKSQREQEQQKLQEPVQSKEKT